LSVGVVVFAPELVTAVKLPWLSVFVFRVGALGACLQVLFMATLVHLLYLDLARQAAWLTVLFCVANAFLTHQTLAFGLPAYGFGFAAASLLALTASLWVLDRALGELEFHVFMRQPV
jgi:uncharacterized membrane protein